MSATATAKALYNYWSSFGIDAYATDSVPDTASLPYLTFDVKLPNWRGVASYTVQIWYRDTSFEAITELVDRINTDIGEGKRIVADDCFIYLYKEDNFFQMYEGEDETLKGAYLSFIIHVLG